MNIIIIHEDNHGVLGVAKDYDSAIDFLVQNQWLTTDVEVLNSIEELVPIKELGLDIETIRSWDIEAFNDFFDGIFYLDVDFLWECNIITIEREVMIMRIDVSIICPFCGEDHAVEVNLAQYEAWQNGELIQNAMPDLTPTEREQFISGLCPKCQAEMFGK